MLKKMSDDSDFLVDIPPETHRHRDKIFIIDYEYCEVYLDEVVEESTYVMDDENLWNEEKWTDNDTISRCFVRNINKMFAADMDYVVTRFAGDLIQEMGRMMESMRPRGITWNFVAFYHNDEETIELFRQPDIRANAVKEKKFWLEAFSRNPFIKQVEVPRAKLLDFRYLDGLFGINRK